ncbi:MAG: nucleotidyltransferase domain-containing protein [Chitinispirillales bacterium]|nr:nucleotidyltransferase domain-containing protein [Chitinispirillales bacterium]
MKKRFEKVAKKYEIEEMYLFGSYARGDATKKSDVDFYIKVDKIRTLKNN